MKINEDKVKERKSFCVHSQQLAIGAGNVINVQIKRMKEKVEAKNNKKHGAKYGFPSKHQRGMVDGDSGVLMESEKIDCNQIIGSTKRDNHLS